MNVLFIDDKSLVIKSFVEAMAGELSGDRINCVFVTDRFATIKNGNLEIININDIEQKKDIMQLQKEYPFSLFKTLVTDRNISNFTNFRNIYKYSNLDELRLIKEIEKYANAYDYLFREKIDCVITGLADNFKFNLAWKIAEFYNKKFYISSISYWHNNGLLFFDKYDQTSSQIEQLYKQYIKMDFTTSEIETLSKIYEKKSVSFSFNDNKIYPLINRLKSLLNKRNTYEEISFKNLFYRKYLYFYTKSIKKIFVDNKYLNLSDINYDYVLFPLHIMPEASILGSSPEIADQFSLIKNISMNLPLGVNLIIKEHPGQVYGYEVNHHLYFSLFSLNNVKLVKENENIYDLIDDKRCIALFTINGTLGLETALRFKKPVFIFGEAYYQCAECFIKIHHYGEIFIWLNKILNNDWKFNEKSLWAILKAINDSIVGGINSTRFDLCKTYKEYELATYSVLKNLILQIKRGEK